MLNDQDYIILENTLVNVFDWESENLEKDFVSFVTSEIPALSNEMALSLFNQFVSLSPLQRDSMYFDLQSFIKTHLA